MRKFAFTLIISILITGIILCTGKNDNRLELPYNWVNLDNKTTRQNKPDARSGHVMAYLGQNTILVYGGMTYNQEKSDEKGEDVYTYSSDTWEYNLENKLWSDYTIKPNVNDENLIYGKEMQIYKNPPVRIRTAMDRIADGKAVMFGGLAIEENSTYYIDDTWIYNTNTHLWSNVEIQDSLKPKARYNHSIAYLEEGKVIMYGGGYEVRGEIESLSDLWVFDINSMMWSQVEVDGEKPEERQLHSMTNIGKGKILMFGGVRWGKPVNDVWVYDYNSNSWSEILIEGISPSERGGQDISYIGDGKVILFGGYFVRNDIYAFPDSVWELDIDNKKWILYEDDSSNHPIGRRGVTMKFVGDGRVIMFGGSYYKLEDRWYFLNDLWELSLK